MKHVEQCAHGFERFRIPETEFPHECVAWLIRNKIQTRLHALFILKHNQGELHHANVPNNNFHGFVLTGELAETHCGRACANWNLRTALLHGCAAHNHRNIIPDTLMQFKYFETKFTGACTSWNLRHISVTSLSAQSTKPYFPCANANLNLRNLMQVLASCVHACSCELSSNI